MAIICSLLLVRKDKRWSRGAEGQTSFAGRVVSRRCARGHIRYIRMYVVIGTRIIPTNTHAPRIVSLRWGLTIVHVILLDRIFSTIIRTKQKTNIEICTVHIQYKQIRNDHFVRVYIRIRVTAGPPRIYVPTYIISYTSMLHLLVRRSKTTSLW